VAVLSVNYLLYPPFIADEERPYFLDREFLSHGDDRQISRAPDAPCLRHRAGSWWVDNDSDRNEAVVTLWSSVTGRQTIPRRCSFALPDGDVELFPWDGERYKVALTVSGSDHLQTRPGHQRTRRRSAVTVVGLGEADRRVADLFKNKPRTRTILAALYREYLTRGHAEPRTLTREEARKCMGFSTPAPVDSALQDVQRAIWGQLGHADEIPRFLVNHHHLKADDQMLIPHRHCGHRDSPSGGFRI
jgi:hypothetical protein